MVYIDLSVDSVHDSEVFYADKLGAFDRTAGRLICNMGVDLIIDLLEPGTYKHYLSF